MVEQFGCSALLHWQVTFNLNHHPRNPTNPHLMEFAVQLHTEQGRNFSDQMPVSLLQTSCCPLSCSALLSPHPVSLVCTRECFKAVLSFLRNLLCVHRLWRGLFSAVITWPNQTHFPPGYRNVDLLPSKQRLPKH